MPLATLVVLGFKPRQWLIDPHKQHKIVILCYDRCYLFACLNDRLSVFSGKTFTLVSTRTLFNQIISWCHVFKHYWPLPFHIVVLLLFLLSVYFCLYVCVCLCCCFLFQQTTQNYIVRGSLRWCSNISYWKWQSYFAQENLYSRDIPGASTIRTIIFFQHWFASGRKSTDFFQTGYGCSPYWNARSNANLNDLVLCLRSKCTT